MKLDPFRRTARATAVLGVAIAVAAACFAAAAPPAAASGKTLVATMPSPSQNLRVQVWTPQAYELWGLRTDEAVGAPLLELDSGLPTERVHAWLQPVLAGQESSVVGERLEAVNRRGRRVVLRVTVTPLRSGDALPSGALVLMEELTPARRDQDQGG